MFKFITNAAVLILLTLYAVPGTADALGGSNYCTEVHGMPFTHITEFQASALVRENRYGDILIAVNKMGSESGRADLVYRIAPQNPDRNPGKPLLARLSDSLAMIDVLEIQTEFYFELRVHLAGEDGMTWVAGVDRSGCGLPSARRDEGRAVFTVSALGIDRYLSPETDRTLTDMLLEFEERPLVPAAH